MSIEKWRPFKELEMIQKEMDHLWDELFPRTRRLFRGGPRLRPIQEEGIAIPAVDIIDKKDALQVKIELPGVEKDQIDLSVDEDSLVIKGEIKKEEEIKEEDYYHCERSYQRFARTIALPTKVDASKIKATFKDGVLEVNLPKAEEVKRKKIKVDVG